MLPAVQNAMIYKAVLLNKQLESEGEEVLEMLDPIAPEAFARAERRLVDLGALDNDHGQLTSEDTLRFPLVDDFDAMALFGGKKACLRRALCVAFYGQLARPRMPATGKNGFTRVLDESTSLKICKNNANFAERTQPHGSTTANEDSGYSDDATLGNQSSTREAEPVIRLGNNSTFWIPEIAATLASPNHLVVFTSLILTDSSPRGEPTAHLLTGVSQEDVEAGAPEWCRIVDFGRVAQVSMEDFCVIGWYVVKSPRYRCAAVPTFDDCSIYRAGYQSVFTRTAEGTSHCQERQQGCCLYTDDCREVSGAHRH